MVVAHRGCGPRIRHSLGGGRGRFEIGMDAWTACIAWGARVVVLVPEGVPASVRRELGVQAGVAHAILESMGYAPALLTLAADDAALDAVLGGGAASGPATDPPATFAPIGEKRTDVRLALDHLHEHARLRPEAVDLPSAAPYGKVDADRDACTLCMACVSVCPASALQAGGDEPRLSFIEMNCVQWRAVRAGVPRIMASPAPRATSSTASPGAARAPSTRTSPSVARAAARCSAPPRWWCACSSGLRATPCSRRPGPWRVFGCARIAGSRTCSGAKPVRGAEIRCGPKFTKMGYFVSSLIPCYAAGWLAVATGRNFSPCLSAHLA